MKNIKFLFTLFISDFAIYKNIYYIVKAFYIILICFDYKNKRIISNISILILGFYYINTKNIIVNLGFDIKALDERVIMNIGGYNILLVNDFFIVLIIDILQAISNFDFIKYNIDQKC